MGLFSFVKDAGDKIFGKKKKAEEAAVNVAVLNADRSAELASMVKKMELPIENLSVQVDGDQVNVSGDAPSNEVREKVILLMGNVDGIASVNDDIRVSEPEPEAVFHTVVRGDTLGGIAKKYYGKGSKYPVIFEANKPMLTDPDRIYPGQMLRIPELPEA